MVWMIRSRVWTALFWIYAHNYVLSLKIKKKKIRNGSQWCKVIGVYVIFGVRVAYFLCLPSILGHDQDKSEQRLAKFWI